MLRFASASYFLRSGSEAPIMVRDLTVIEFFTTSGSCHCHTDLEDRNRNHSHAPLATTDAAPVCFNLISYYYFAKFAKHKTPLPALKAGATLGLALISKENSAYLLPVYAIILLAEALKNRPTIRDIKFDITPSKAAPYILLYMTAITVINAAYLFKTDYTSPPSFGPEKLLTPTQLYTRHFTSLRNHLTKSHAT